MVTDVTPTGIAAHLKQLACTNRKEEDLSVLDLAALQLKK
jgi:hypothetical protein